MLRDTDAFDRLLTISSTKVRLLLGGISRFGISCKFTHAHGWVTKKLTNPNPW